MRFLRFLLVMVFAASVTRAADSYYYIDNFGPSVLTVGDIDNLDTYQTMFRGNEIHVDGVISGGENNIWFPGNNLDIRTAVLRLNNPENTYRAQTSVLTSVSERSFFLYVTKLAPTGQPSSLGKSGDLFFLIYPGETDAQGTFIYDNPTEDGVFDRKTYVGKITSDIVPASLNISVPYADRTLDWRGAFERNQSWIYVNKIGAGTLTLSNPDSNVSFRILEGTLRANGIVSPGVGFTSTLGVEAELAIANAAKLQFVDVGNIGGIWAGQVALGAGGGVIDVVEGPLSGIGVGLTLVSRITGAGNAPLIKEGGGALWLLSSESSYSGGTDIRDGTVFVGSLTNAGQNSSLGTGNVTVSNGGRLFLTSNAVQSTDRTLTVGAGGAALGADIGSILTWNGEILGNSTLTITGKGVVALGGVQTNTAVTTIVQDSRLRVTSGSGLLPGNLQLSNSILQTSGNFTRGLGSGAGQIALSGVSGFSAVGGNLTINLGGNFGTIFYPANFAETLVLNDAFATGTISFRNSVNLGAGSHLKIRTDAGIARLPFLEGTGNLTISGAGTLESAGGDATGTLTVSGTRLRTTPSSLSSMALILDNGILQSNGTYTRPIGSGSGTISLRNASGFSAVGGNLTVNLGGGAVISQADLPSTLILNDSVATGDIAFLNPIALVSGMTTTIQSNANFARLHGLITGEGNLVVKSGSRVEFLRDNTFTGSFTFDGSEVVVPTIRNLGEASAIGSGALQLNNGARLAYLGGSVSLDRGLGTFGGDNRLEIRNANATLSLAGHLYGSGNLEKAGPGGLVLGGSMDLLGTVSVLGGSLEINAPASVVQSIRGFRVGTVAGQAGTLRILSGQVLTTPRVDGPVGDTITFDDYDADTTIGHEFNAPSTVWIDGPNTRWESRGNIAVGSLASGTMTISNGAAVDVSSGWWSEPWHQSGQGVTRTVFVGRTADGVLNIGSQNLANPTTGGSLAARQLIIGGDSEAFLQSFRNSFPLYSQTSGYYVPNVMSMGMGTLPNSTVNFNQTDVFTLDADIGGFGTLVQRGTGTTILSGNSTRTDFLYRIADFRSFFDGTPNPSMIHGPRTLAPLGFHGNVVVESGTLRVNGTLTSNSTIVKSGGTLGGSGLITKITLESGSTLAPGNSVGTLFSDTLVWESGAVLSYELADMASDLLVLSGALTAEGSGNHQFTFLDDGWQIGQTYKLIEFASTNFDVGDFGFTNGGGFDGVFHLDGDSLDFTLLAIPEPSTGILAVLALLLLLRPFRFFRSRSRV